jgi:hypothetical protein
MNDWRAYYKLWTYSALGAEIRRIAMSQTMAVRERDARMIALRYHRTVACDDVERAMRVSR